MFNRNKGIRAILNPRLSREEIAEDTAAKEYVRRRVGPLSDYKPLDPAIYRVSATLDKLQAAGTAPVKKTWSSEKEFENYITKRPSPKEYKGTWNKFKKQQEAKRKAADPTKGAKYVPWYSRNTEADDGVKKFNHHDNSTYPYAQKEKLMKAEIDDKIKRGKLPTKEGMKTLQYVTDTVKNYDDMPVSHKPRWMVNYQNGELEDVNHPDWVDNQIKQGLAPGSLVKQHKAENKPKIQKTNFGYVKTIPEKKPIVKQLEALRDFGQNRLIKEDKK
tara:strand:- start:101 stop:922 length:822 start_codon:yes stop_codon:yes gene_type:complete